MVRPATVSLALAALVSTVPIASAQTRRESEDIIVTGKRAPPIEATRAILRAITPKVGVRDQMPRLFDPACIAVGGVRAPIAHAIADRLVANAVEAGVVVGQPNCKANVLVFIATDGRGQARELLRTQSYAFGDAKPAKIADFTDTPGPARLFSTVELASPDGDRPDESGTVAAAGGVNLGFDAPTLKLGSSTRIGAAVRRTVTSVVLVIDRAAIVGKTPIQIADYATMRVLSGAAYTPDAGNETILSLLEPAVAPPTELTKIDRALLAEMYRNRDLRTAQAEINAAARIATRE